MMVPSLFRGIVRFDARFSLRLADSYCHGFVDNPT